LGGSTTESNIAAIARMLGADALLLLTDADAVFAEWGAPQQMAIARAEPRALRALPFAPRSMAPKVEAACDFVEATAGLAAIGRVGDALAMLEGRAGTTINSTATGINLQPG
jgi:carbamate kinase